MKMDDDDIWVLLRYRIMKGESWKCNHGGMKEAFANSQESVYGHEDKAPYRQCNAPPVQNPRVPDVANYNIYYLYACLPHVCLLGEQYGSHKEAYKEVQQGLMLHQK